MMSAHTLGQSNTFDVVVVGGGTAGCIVAARLAEDPDLSVALIEWGPSDREEPRARTLRRWADMLEGEYDLDYRSVPQPRGNSDIRQARMRILGGCSTANTMITWRPLAADLAEWSAMGIQGWGPEELWPCFDRLKTPIEPVPPADQNPVISEVIDSAVTALQLPRRNRWNGYIDQDASGAGFFEVGYTAATNMRSSTSIHYIHPLMGTRKNLTVITSTRVEKLLLDTEDRVVGVKGHHRDGGEVTITATRRVVLSCGAIDTPRLLQLSGIGPREVLAEAGVDCRVDLPGVGENLMDHVEGLVVWEVTEAAPTHTSASGWDAGALIPLTEERGHPDVLMHFPVEAWVVHPESRGFAMPSRIMSIAANVARPKSRGTVRITSADSNMPPRLDYRYFTDPDGADEDVLLQAVDLARKVGEAEPFASRIVREVFPESGPIAQVSQRERASHQTVYHVSGTARMGSDSDPMAVLDDHLNVRGVSGLSVVDASALPVIPSVNPVGTIMALAERASDLIKETL